MQRLRRIRTRVRAGFVPAPLAFLCALPHCTALAALTCVLACLLVGGCSPGTEYPSIFPAVHDMPPPRVEAPMDQLQVQKATEDLITQRDHLNASAPSPSPGQTKTDPANASADPTANTASAPAAKKKTAAHQTKAQQAGAVPPATTASAQTAGTDPKP